MEIENVSQQIKAELSSRARSQTLDGFLYNGGIVFTLTCTGVATIIGAVNGGPNPIIYPWIPPLLSGVATIWIGIDRALQFGQRWRFHRIIAARNTSLMRRIDTVNLLPAEEQGPEVLKIREEFVLIPSLNPDVPGLPPNERKP